MLLLRKCCHQNLHFSPLNLLLKMSSSNGNNEIFRRFIRSRSSHLLQSKFPRVLASITFPIFVNLENIELISSSSSRRRNHCTLCNCKHFLSQSHKFHGYGNGFKNFPPANHNRLSASMKHSALLPIYLQSSCTLFSLAHTNKREFTERRIMGYSMEQMYNVVSDVENYNKFLPWCESSKVLQRTDNLIIADLIIGMKPVTESYTSKVTLRKPQLVQAVSTKGRYFKNMFTTWKFSPGLKAKPQSTCIVDFYVSLEFLSVIHANVANVFFNEVVKAMAGAFYSEAKRRYGPESVPSRKISIVSSNTSNKSGHEKEDL